MTRIYESQLNQSLKQDLAGPLTDKLAEPVMQAPQQEMEFAVLDAGDTTGADSFKFDTGENEQKAITPLGAAKIAKQAMTGAIKFMKFVQQALDGPDTPELSVADEVKKNHDHLIDIKDDLGDVQVQLDQVLGELDGISDQINTNLISEVTVDAFNLLDLIGNTPDPTTTELNSMVADGQNVMNLALQAAQDASASAPAAFIAGHVAPALMLAAAARIGSVTYASDQGLGASAVQADLQAVEALLLDIFSPEGALGQQIIEETEVETYAVYGFNGSHVFEFMVVETFTGPGGSVLHNVITHHGDSAGSTVSDDFPSHYTRTGTINGVSASEDWQAAAAEAAGLSVDYSVPFMSDHVDELNAAFDWAEAARPDTFYEMAEDDISAFGVQQVQNFIAELPATFGLNESDSGGSGGDTIEGSDGSGEISFVAADLIYGGGGNDVLRGHGERDALFGEAGNDTLEGGEDNDRLFGGHNNDRLYGGDGHDKLQGQHGRDTLEGGDGHDVLFQSERGDFFTFQDPDNFNQTASHGGTLDGGKGNDLLVGDQGGDNLEGGVGHDTIYGYGGADEADGGAGNDMIYTGDGADEVFGRSGNDTIEGGDGDDTIDGGFGDDMIIGGAGDDEINGGYGVDTVVFYGEFHGDVSTGEIGSYAVAGVGDDDGEESDFSIVQTADGSWIVSDIRDNPTDGVDTIYAGGQHNGGYGVEFLLFDNITIAIEPVGLDPTFTVNPTKAHVNPDLGEMAGDLLFETNDPGIW